MNRTKKQWENYCLEYLKKRKGFSVFWATDNKFIANAMDRLVKSKKIIITPMQFPNSKVKIRVREKL